MQTLRKLPAAVVLTCVLTISAIGGDMGTHVNPPAPPPPPVPESQPRQANATEPKASDMPSAGDELTDIAFNLLQTLLTLF